MVKLRFDNLSLSQFNKFKLVPKKRKQNINGNKRLTTTLVKGLCIKDNEEFKIQLNVKALKPNIIESGQPDLLILPFTEESYNLRGVVSVFDKNPDKDGRYIRYIRNEAQCKFFPGSKEKLVPFCPNWVCNGYIVRRDNKLMFEFNECLSPNGYGVFISDDDD